MAQKVTDLFVMEEEAVLLAILEVGLVDNLAGLLQPVLASEETGGLFEVVDD